MATVAFKAGWVTFYRCPASRVYLRPKRDPRSCDLPWIRAQGLRQALLADLRGLAAEPAVSASLKAGLAKADDPEAEYRAAMAKLDFRLTRAYEAYEDGAIDRHKHRERVNQLNTEKQALRARQATERKAFNPDEWDERFAGIVAATVAQRTGVDPTALLAQHGRRRAVRGATPWDRRLAPTPTGRTVCIMRRRPTRSSLGCGRPACRTSWSASRWM